MHTTLPRNCLYFVTPMYRRYFASGSVHRKQSRALPFFRRECEKWMIDRAEFFFFIQKRKRTATEIIMLGVQDRDSCGKKCYMIDKSIVRLAKCTSSHVYAVQKYNNGCAVITFLSHFFFLIIGITCSCRVNHFYIYISAVFVLFYSLVKT